MTDGKVKGTVSQQFLPPLIYHYLRILKFEEFFGIWSQAPVLQERQPPACMAARLPVGVTNMQKLHLHEQNNAIKHSNLPVGGASSASGWNLDSTS